MDLSSLGFQHSVAKKANSQTHQRYLRRLCSLFGSRQRLEGGRQAVMLVTAAIEPWLLEITKTSAARLLCDRATMQV